MSRTKQSIKNIISGIGSQVVLALLSLFTTKIIKSHLGFEYLGLNGVFTNIVSFLNLTELGIGSAIVFALYKPLAEKDEKKILSLMQFYKKAYHVIAFFIFIIGMLLIPFLKVIVKSSLDYWYIVLVFLLFLINTVSSYFLSYKQSLISADQKNYIITLYSLVFQIITKLIQLSIVLFINDFILYLVAGIFCTFLLNVLLAIKANKIYPYLKSKDYLPLDKETRKLIITKTKAMFLHSIGYFVISGTDNIIISSFLGVVIVGKYGVYISIISMVLAVTNQFYNGIFSSVGNFIAEKNNIEQYLLFKKLDVINSCAQIFIPVCLAMLFNPFIKLWLGEDALLSNYVVYLLALNTFISIMRKPIHIFKTTSGLFEKDRYAPIIESVLNIVISIGLVKYIGVEGVILGTVVSSLLVPVWYTPFVVYKYLFNRNIIEYFRTHFFNLCLTVLIIVLLNFLFGIITIANEFVLFLVEVLIVGVVAVGFVLLFYGRSLYKLFLKKE